MSIVDPNLKDELMAISYLSRRGFMRMLGGSALAALSGSFPNVAFAVAPMVVIAAASTALTAVRMFSGKGSGLEAMLSAQVQLLGLVLNQLDDVQNELRNVRDDIQKLEGSLRGQFEAQFRNELIQSIIGTCSFYHQRAKGVRYNPAEIRNKEIQEDFQYALQQVAKERATLRQLPAGCGSEVAMVLPLMLGVELSCMGHLGYSTAHKLIVLEEYEKLINVMRGFGVGSIPSQIQAATQAHNEVILEFEKTQLGKELKVAEFQIGGGQGKKNSNICHGVMPLPSATPYVGAEHIREFMTYTYWSAQSIWVQDDPSLGIKMINNSDLTMTIAKLESTSIYPPKGVPCRIHGRSNVNSWSKDYATDWFETQSADPRIKQRQQLAGVIASANYQRAVIGMYLKANEVVSSVDLAINRFRYSLTGSSTVKA